MQIMTAANEIIDSATLVASLIATLLAICLIALQTDLISKHILSPSRLRVKRRREQIHCLDTAFASSILFLRQYINEGGIYQADVERKITDFVRDEEEIAEIVKTNILTNTCSNGHVMGAPLIVGISVDLTSKQVGEWFIYLAFSIPPPSITTATAIEDKGEQGPPPVTRYGQRIQFPLLPFGKALADAFDEWDEQGNNNISYDVCFVADASSGLGSRVLGQVFDHMSKSTGLVVFKELAWMSTLAHLVTQRKISSKDMERILLGLVRLTAHSIAQETQTTKSQTMVFLLPGQSCTAALWPLLQTVFPNQRHVLTYDGCIDSIQRGILLRNTTRSKKKRNRHNQQQHSQWVDSDLHITAMPRNISATTPISLLKRIPDMAIHMTQLNANQVDTLEAWMSSVDTFFKIQEEVQNRTTSSPSSYPPFVCHVGVQRNANERTNHLFGKEPSLLDHSDDESLKHLLQHVMGSESSIQEEVFDAAKSILSDIRVQVLEEECNAVEIKDKEQVAIEHCVSQLG